MSLQDQPGNPRTASFITSSVRSLPRRAFHPRRRSQPNGRVNFVDRVLRSSTIASIGLRTRSSSSSGSRRSFPIQPGGRQVSASLFVSVLPFLALLSSQIRLRAKGSSPRSASPVPHRSGGWGRRLRSRDRSFPGCGLQLPVSLHAPVSAAMVHLLDLCTSAALFAPSGRFIPRRPGWERRPGFSGPGRTFAESPKLPCRQ